jgi:quercetin dioxygenase-like cupin family protein
MSTTALLSAERADLVVLDAGTLPPAASIVSRTLLQANDVRVTLFSFAAGQELTTHTNRRRALIQVLGGTGEFLFNDHWEQLSAGALLHLPPNHPHAVRAREPFTMLLTLSSEPVSSKS